MRRAGQYAATMLTSASVCEFNDASIAWNVQRMVKKMSKTQTIMKSLLATLASLLMLAAVSTIQAQPFAYITNFDSSNVSVIGGGRFCANQQLRNLPRAFSGVHNQYSVYAARARRAIRRTCSDDQRGDESGQDSAFWYRLQMV